MYRSQMTSNGMMFMLRVMETSQLNKKNLILGHTHRALSFLFMYLQDSAWNSLRHYRLTQSCHF